MTRRSLIAILIIIAALVGARQLVLTSRSRAAGEYDNAQWIWGFPRGEHGSPMALFVAKDFQLPFNPASAEIEITADEEYQLTINGRGVAGGRYRGRLDAYPVGNILRGGSNRIVVEVRSARGAGGLLVRLKIDGPDGERVTVVSDDSWRAMHQFVPGVTRPSGGNFGVPVRVWGSPPTGRWVSPGDAVPALTLRRLQGGRTLRPQPALRCQRLGEQWKVAEQFGTEPLGPWVTFDFGRQRTGFINLRFADGAASNALLFYGLHRPKDGLENPDEVVIRPLGREHWTAAGPARFRFVTVVGALQVAAGEVIPVVPELAEDLVGRESVTPLFGVDRSLTLVSPVEHEVRRKLEGIPSVAGRKEG